MTIGIEIPSCIVGFILGVLAITLLELFMMVKKYREKETRD